MTVQLVGWALIHSLWQGALIAALLGIALTVLRKAPAAWRHIACLIALVAMPVLPLVTSARMIAQPPAGDIAAEAKTDAGGATARTDRGAIQTASDAGVPASSPPAMTSVVARSWRLDIERIFPWLVAGWLFGVLLLSLRVIGGYVRARALVHTATGAVSTEISAAARRIAERLRVGATVHVLESARAQVPMVIGMVKPVVLMPASLLSGLSLPQVEAILAHELAHVRRYDYAINLFQTVIETFFFFHPAVWWLSRRLRDEREQACDELAVSLCGGDPVFYSRVLLTVEEWRSERISFAPAATGGTLATRIRKLIGDDERKLDVGPRWFAGIVTVVAVVVATAGAVSDRADAQSTRKLDEVPASQDTARARPSVIHKFAGTGTLEERWKWATETARKQNLERYWIGYIVRTSGTNDWLYLDHAAPIQAGNSWVTGHMRFNGDFNNMKFSGTSLVSLLGSYSPNDHAIFLGFDATSRRPSLVRVHLANFVFPMHFDRWPLLWLDEVPAAQSVQAIAALKDAAATKDVLNDLPDVIGAHEDTPAVMPILVAWLQDKSAPRDFRMEAIEALGYHGTPEALAAAIRVARSSEDEDLRAEAVEVLGELPIREAADSLMVLATALDSERLRAEAVESLGERPEGHIPAFLERIARTGETRTGMEAIEALAELPDNRGATIVFALAQDPKLRLDLRHEAIEALADLPESPLALETLRKIVFEDPDVAIQVEATETIADMADPRAADALVEIVEKHPVLQVQMKATEALADVSDHKAALTALDKIARNHPQRAVRIEALEAMGDFSSDGAGAMMLIGFLRSNPEEGLGIAALEALADAGAPRSVAQFIDSLLQSDASLGLKIEALETLEDLPDEVAVPLLEKYANSSNLNLRAKAAEILADKKN